VRTVIFLLLLSASSLVNACVLGPLSSNNKFIHLIGTGSLVYGIERITHNSDLAISLAVGAGVIREVQKVRILRANCEYSSMLWDAAGISLGLIAIQPVLIVPNSRGLRLVVVREF
jgi:hypothetical protein